MKIAQTLAAGFVAIGMATALFLPGRQTAPVIKATGNAVQGVFKTTITGK
ncbi:MAG: hypothetical protein ACRDNK_04235 [Solirubrobacteraceae bacterium]